ncbi:MAG: UdgX family uracil-DNA binding protein [Phycisphaerales bacterium]
MDVRRRGECLPPVVVDPAGDFERWVAQSRSMIRDGVHPATVWWIDSTDGEASLFPKDDATPLPENARPIRIPRRFKEIARRVAVHRDPERWTLLYRVLWRLTCNSERRLLDIEVDEDVRRLHLLEKAVRRDCHKMKAFVRFRRVPDVDEDRGERFVAWHRPDHRIVPLVAPFFARRFGVLRWTIFTPLQSVDWDGESLRFGEGAPASLVKSDDRLDELWVSYYRSIFNPARIKLKAMIAEMPTRHWPTLPEARVIHELLDEAPQRVRDMHARTVTDEMGAASFIPEARCSLPVLRDAAIRCEGCALHECASQVVFGEGPSDATVMLVGEQPGDQEDQAGRPFVGPAGAVLKSALRDAGLERSELYLTNAVKHFKYTLRGKRRIHQKPNAIEMRACRPWLEREIEVIDPALIVCLGSTAAHSFFGAGFRVMKNRGAVLPHPTRPSTKILITVHPSSILRTPEPARATNYARFVADLEGIGRQVDLR